MVIGIGQEFVEDGVLFFQRLRDTGVGYGQGNEHGAVLLDDRQELRPGKSHVLGGADQQPAAGQEKVARLEQAGEVVQGGSTLTQQFVKNVFLSHEQSMERKIEEAVLSLMLEDNYSKDEILELYLNTTYFGAGSTGIKQASRTYFGKAPSALTLAEAAVIASLPYAPTSLNPLENPEGCKKRQLLVLAAMHKYGMINQGQLAEAKAEKIRLTNGTVM